MLNLANALRECPPAERPGIKHVVFWAQDWEDKEEDAIWTDDDKHTVTSTFREAGVEFEHRVWMEPRGEVEGGYRELNKLTPAEVEEARRRQAVLVVDNMPKGTCELTRKAPPEELYPVTEVEKPWLMRVDEEIAVALVGVRMRADVELA